MRIMINGEWTEQSDELNVTQLLTGMSLEPRRVAVERNKQIVRRPDFETTWLADEDQLEIVTLVGGG